MILERIEILKKKLDEAVIKYGLNSNEVKNISKKIETIMNKEMKNKEPIPTGNKMRDAYNMSIYYMKIITIEQEKFPSTEEWDEYASKIYALNSKTIRYITGLNWHKLRCKIEQAVY